MGDGPPWNRHPRWRVGGATALGGAVGVGAAMLRAVGMRRGSEGRWVATRGRSNGLQRCSAGGREDMLFGKRPLGMPVRHGSRPPLGSFLDPQFLQRTLFLRGKLVQALNAEMPQKGVGGAVKNGTAQGLPAALLLD